MGIETNVNYRLTLLEKEVQELGRKFEHLKPKEPLNVHEVAKILNRKPMTITHWARNMHWFGVKHGRKWHFTYDMIDRIRAHKKMKYTP